MAVDERQSRAMVRMSRVQACGAPGLLCEAFFGKIDMSFTDSYRAKGNGALRTPTAVPSATRRAIVVDESTANDAGSIP